MITAVDTNVLLDLLVPDAQAGAESEHQLQAAAEAGAVVISPSVAAELAAFFGEEVELQGFMDGTGLRVDQLQLGALYTAGQAWKTYAQRRGPMACPQCRTVQAARCGSCGAQLRVRQHIISDFLIGAHALVQADQLLTRDRGYYRTYFPKLKLADHPNG